MTGVDTIARIRFEHHQNGKGIKRIARELGIARDTVRKVLRSNATVFAYKREVQPQPKLGPFVAVLTAILEAEAKLPRRERRSTQRLFEELRGRGYAGAHDSVHRFVKTWRAERARVPVQAFVPLAFDPGEAYQFDWSHEVIEFCGLPLTVKVAQMRLAHARMPFVCAYFRETQEMVFDAHDRAFAFYGGTCRRGIYDNMKTAVETVFVGKARTYNQRFLQLCSHHLVEPVACTPAAGWEKGQVENQVGTVRDLLFRPRPKVRSLDELNAWLADQCVAYAKRTRHPEQRERTIWEVFEQERASLMPLRGPFAGFVEKPMRATSTCLIAHDRNRYSVDARAAGRSVLVRVYAARIVVLLGEEVVADHPRSFRREQVVYDPWHYLPVLMRKPGALRNGAPFKDWDLPPALAGVRAKLARHADGDRQFVKVLARVPEDGMAAVEAACAEALAAGLASGNVILAILARQRQLPAPPSITTPEALRLTTEPMADCARYDRLRPSTLEVT
ncbi:IS21 family transposase [Methylobacterium sp. DCY52]|uniref:IS21 family transposase n=1 Tax=Methylobacterium sp. DCY52 TaxID=739139 RepID=UPI00406D23D3